MSKDCETSVRGGLKDFILDPMLGHVLVWAVYAQEIQEF